MAYSWKIINPIYVILVLLLNFSSKLNTSVLLVPNYGTAQIKITGDLHVRVL